jgi:hypothetical protein
MHKCVTAGYGECGRWYLYRILWVGLRVSDIGGNPMTPGTFLLGVMAKTVFNTRYKASFKGVWHK